MMKSIKFLSAYGDIPFEIDLFNDEEYVKDKLKLDYEADYVDIGVDECAIEWEFSTETRDWGIKTLSAYATKAILVLHCEWYDENDKDHEKSIIVDLTDWEMESRAEDGYQGAISVRNVEFNFKEKTISVDF